MERSVVGAGRGAQGCRISHPAWPCSPVVRVPRPPPSRQRGRARCRVAGWSRRAPRRRRVLDRVVLAVLADREDAQVGLAVVDELVRRASGPRSWRRSRPGRRGSARRRRTASRCPRARGSPPPRCGASGSAAERWPGWTTSRFTPMRRSPAARPISVVRPKLSPPGSASFSPIGELVDADEPGRAAVGALDELLGAHAVGLADAPLAAGEHAALDPAARARSRRATSVQASIHRPSRSIVRNGSTSPRTRMSSPTAEIGSGKRRGWRETAATVRTGRWGTDADAISGLGVRHGRPQSRLPCMRDRPRHRPGHCKHGLWRDLVRRPRFARARAGHRAHRPAPAARAAAGRDPGARSRS